MNSLQDPTKKAAISIRSLLNIEEPLHNGHGHGQVPHHSFSDGAIEQQRPHNHGQGLPAHSPPPYPGGTSFRLRSVGWDGATHPDVQQSHHNGRNGYSSERRDGYGFPPIAPRTSLDHEAPYSTSYRPHSRPRASSVHSMTGVEPAQAWQPPHESSSGVSRAVVPSGLEPTTGYPNTGRCQPSAAEWQASERASLRLAARGSMPPMAHANISHQPYPMTPSGYPVMVAYTAQIHPQQDPQHHSTSSKRQLPEGEASAPKAKRPAKAKPKVGPEGSPAPSKRGFTAKKRNEAAQIAAHNVPDKAPENGNATVIVQHRGHIFETQFARCMSNRYRNEDFPRCVSCTRRWAGDTCRFQGIRCFVKDASQDNKAIVGMRFNSAKLSDVPELHFPKTWNVPLNQGHIDRCKKVIAKALLSTLKSEREHLGLLDLIRRARESDVRVTCDTCMTSIFSSSWMCRLCGREACADCYNLVCELTKDPPGATPQQVQERHRRREKYAHGNPFFLGCTKRNEHQADCFSPMSRFFAEELDDAIEEMESVLDRSQMRIQNGSGGHGEGDSSGAAFNHTNAVTKDHPPTGVSLTWAAIFKSKAIRRADFDPSLMPSASRAAGESYIPPNLVEAASATPYFDIYRYTDDELTPADDPDKFSKIWAYGEPVVVANILNKFSIEWTPEYFIAEFGDRECLITECEQDSNKKTTIKEFFGGFGKYEGRDGAVWKLKDWPPSADFKTTFPKLYKDFSDAVPVPDYVRRDGVCNLGSHFPSNVIAPDLGPKMYNAWAANQNPGCKGSTRLHMDMADAVNVMLFAAPCPDGSPGCAVWDIYRADDSDKIRRFLRSKHNLGQHYDPIHGQQYYLDDSLRSQLYKEYAVTSYRIYQRPGEAVFIPAGCAHQVSNLADSIKIATDYVSPENISRCAQLTKEFREQNKSKVWKEDILQLKTMMWFAWQSCSKQEKRLRGEAQEGASDSSSNSREGAASPSGRQRADTTSSQSVSGSTPRSNGN